MTDTSQPQVRSFPWAKGYQAHFMLPGGRWQFVRAKGQKTAEIFPTSEAAKDAAMALVFRFMCPPIVATKADGPEPANDDEMLERAIVAAVGSFKESRERQRIEDRKVLRGLGKGFVTVETKRKRA